MAGMRDGGCRGTGGRVVQGVKVVVEGRKGEFVAL